MRYYNYLNEKDTNGYRIIIENNCSQFLKESSGLPLYRGMSNKHNFKILETHRKRNSMNTIEEIQHTADKLFQKRFGWKARSEYVLYGTGSVYTTALYGNTHVIFPFDGYKFVYSNNIKDFYDHLMTYMTDELDIQTDVPWKVSSFYRQNQPIIDEYIEQMVKLYTNRDLVKALNRGNEIMFQTKKYIAISPEIYRKIF